MIQYKKDSKIQNALFDRCEEILLAGDDQFWFRGKKGKNDEGQLIYSTFKPYMFYTSMKIENMTISELYNKILTESKDMPQALDYIFP